MQNSANEQGESDCAVAEIGMRVGRVCDRVCIWNKVGFYSVIFGLQINTRSLFPQTRAVLLKTNQQKLAFSFIDIQRDSPTVIFMVSHFKRTVESCA